MVGERRDDEERVTNGELMRTCVRIEQGLTAVNTKVDEQGRSITGVHIRLTEIDTAVGLRLKAIEAAQASVAFHPIHIPIESPASRTAKPVAAGAGLGAAVLGLIQWAIAHWR